MVRFSNTQYVISLDGPVCTGMGWEALLWGQAANILLLSVNVTPPEAVLNTLHGARSPLARGPGPGSPNWPKAPPPTGFQ